VISNAASPARARTWKAWLLAALPAILVGVVVVVAWPGYVSFDSAFQWHQARTGQFSEVAPPMMPALWALLMGLGFPATSGPLVLIGGLHAFGFARLALLAHAAGRGGLAWTIALLAPLSPFLVSMFPHVWTDLVLSGALVAAFSLCLPRFPLGLARGIAVALLLFIASGVRHNGILAVLPLVIWWGWMAWPRVPHWQRAVLIAGLIALLWFGKLSFAQTLVSGRLDTWAVAPMIDLQAVSVATDRQLIPASLVGPGMDVTQLREAFDPYWSDLFSATKSGVINPTIEALTRLQRTELRQAWIALLTEPHWWRHRLRLFLGLLGPHSTPALSKLADNPELRAYADNPPLERRFAGAHSAYRSLIEAMRTAGLLAPGLYLLLGLGAGIVLWIRRLRVAATLPQGIGIGPIMALLGSAWMYTVPYFVLAPSAESRYLVWPVAASWLAFLIVFSGLASRGSGRGGAGSVAVGGVRENLFG